MQTTPSFQSVNVKLACMLILTIADVFINSFIESSFSLSVQDNYVVNYYFIPIQILVTSFTFIMMLIMLWQTFPLRYGLLSTLCSEFRWTFTVVLLFIFITAVQRGFRLSLVISSQANFKQTQIWNNVGYTVLYYIRYLTYPLFYGFLINFCIKILDPSFYRPNRWLK